MPRILIADDDPATRSLLRRVLEDEGHVVETAPDGRAALEIVARSSPDVLITDLIMPGLAGWSVFSRVRRHLPTLPIIVISGSDIGGGQQEKSLSDHAVFLRKPLAISQLLAVIARLLDQTWSDRDTSEPRA